MTSIGRSATATPHGGRLQGWRRITAWRGGTVTALLAAGESGTLIGATSAGVFELGPESRWRRLDAASVMPAATCLASSPDAPTDLWAGGAAGVFRSVDAGRSWTHALGGTAVISLAAPPDGAVVAGTLDEGVVRSDDRGRTWHPANGGLLELSVDAIVAIPGGHRLVAGTEGGLWRSYNSGRSWQPVDDVPSDESVSCVVAIDAHELLAGTMRGLLWSEDQGDSWRAVEAFEPVAISAIAARGDVVAVAAGCEVHLSSDRGRTWKRLRTAPEPVISLALSGSGTVFAGLTGQGVLTCTAGSPAWAPLSDGLEGRLVTSMAAARDARGGVAIVATSAGGASLRCGDDGSLTVPALPELEGRRVTSAPGDGALWAYGSDGLHRSDDGGLRWEDVQAATPIDALAVGRAGATQTIVVAAQQGELRESRDGGTTWATIASIPTAGRVVGMEMLEAGIALLLLEVAGTGHREVWAVGSQAYRCLGAAPGQTLSMATYRPWDEREAGCIVAAADEVYQLAMHEAGPSAERLPPAPGTISAIKALPSERSFLVATDQGLFLTENGGSTYLPQKVPEDLGAVLFIDSVPGDPETVCVACLGGDIWTCRVSR